MTELIQPNILYAVVGNTNTFIASVPTSQQR